MPCGSTDQALKLRMTETETESETEAKAETETETLTNSSRTLEKLSPALWSSIGSVVPASNECFSSHGETKKTLELIPLLLQRGHMVMCSDFSLKALIRQWSVDHLGPNPFIKIGEFGGFMRLEFDRARVAECQSAQLRNAQT